MTANQKSQWTWVAVLGGLLAILATAGAVSTALLDARYPTIPVARSLAAEVCDARCMGREDGRRLQLEVTDRLGRIETSVGEVRELLREQRQADRQHRASIGGEP